MENKICAVIAGFATTDLGKTEMHLAGSSFKRIGVNSNLVQAEQDSRVKRETSLAQLF